MSIARTNMSIVWTKERIVALRSALNMTQEAFAAAVGVPQETVSRWEAGHARPETHTSITGLRSLARRLKKGAQARARPPAA